MKKLITIALNLVAISGALAYNTTEYITSNGISRAFELHSIGMTQHSQNMPLVIVLHGDGGNGASIKGFSGFDAVADANNFMVVYPDALNATWNRYVDNVPGDAGLNNPNAPDDVLFISELIDYLCANYHIKNNKVYVTGHSAGGFMAYNLAIQLPDKIAAIAPVSASIWGDNAFITNYFSNAYVPMPVHHIHGDADGTVDYPDTDHTPIAWQEYPLSSFAFANCGNDTYISTTNVTSGGTVKKMEFCSTGKKVELVQIVGGGHTWPIVSGYNVAQDIWNFCNTYSITPVVSCSISTGITESSIKDKTSPFIFPNPSNGIFSIKSDVFITELKAFDFLGNEIKVEQETQLTYKIFGKQGLYTIKVIDNNGHVFSQKILLKQ